jgi:DHA1 family tetracycline resistance protein-like MFS transporter
MSSKRPLLPIFLIVLVDIMGFTLVIPLLAIYAETYGASPFVATSLVSTYAVCQLVSGPLLGRASDRVGRKPMLLLSQLGTCAGFILLARANALWVIFAARALDGATAGNLSLAQAYISDNTPPEKRASSFALIGIAFGIGFFLGPSMTGMLTPYGLAAPIYAAAGLSLTSILCTLFLLPGGRPAASVQQQAPRPFRLFARPASLEGPNRSVLLGLLGQFFCFSVAFSLYMSGFALFSERRFRWNGHPFGPHEIGLVFGYVGFLGIILQGGLFKRLAKRFGEWRLTSIGFGAMVVYSTILSGAHGLVALAIAATLSPMGNAFIRPTLTSFITQKADRGEQGAVLGFQQSLQATAQIIAPLVAGLLIDRGWLPAWAGCTALAAGAGLFLARWGSGKMKAKGNVPGAPTGPSLATPR